MSEKIEIGYLCSRGHFVFHDDPEGGGCESKRIAGVYVERDAGIEFYPPFEEKDETGFVFYSGCGYSEDDYNEEVTEARQSLASKIMFWRKNA